MLSSGFRMSIDSPSHSRSRSRSSAETASNRAAASADKGIDHEAGSVVLTSFRANTYDMGRAVSRSALGQKPDHAGSHSHGDVRFSFHGPSNCDLENGPTRADRDEALVFRLPPSGDEFILPVLENPRPDDGVQDIRRLL